MSSSINLVESLGGTKTLEHALDKNLNWIKLSFQVNNNLGSSAHQTISGKWSISYPETTGYLVPTLLSASLYKDDEELSQLAHRQLIYFKSINSIDGGFYSNNQKNKKLFFDNSQIQFGLIALYKLNNDQIKNTLIDNYNWLLEQIEPDKPIINNSYKTDYIPSYFSRSCWALLETEQVLNIDHSHKTYSLLDLVKNKKNKNHSFKSWSFDGRDRAFSHSIIYAFRGLLESAIILKDQTLIDQTLDSVKYINQEIVPKFKNQLWGSYDQKWKPDTSYICSVGNAQFCLLLLLSYKITDDPSYLKNIVALARPLISSQNNILNSQKGALPSSIPIWGKYQRFNYTNWTQKFYTDLLLSLLSFQIQK